jgi:D-glycero-alpha-D-manno-heptose-7-phosphate kinase
MLTVTRTPLRVSFFGGGTDLPFYYRDHGGAVLTSTIDKYIHVFARRRWDNRIVVHHTRVEVAGHLDDVEHALSRECLRATGFTGGIEISAMSDVPTAGSGLGASSAYTVGLLLALTTLQNRPTPPAELAELACHVEIDMVGSPIGKQDQYATALGGFHQLLFAEDGTVSAQRVEVQAGHRAALNTWAHLFFTGRTRHAGAVLRRWQNNPQAGATSLHAIKAAVPAGRQALENGDLAAMARLLDQSWQQKQLLSGDAGDPEFARMYELACKAGALGGKLLGAGNGGFFLFLSPPETQESLLTTLDGHEPMPFEFIDEGATVTALAPATPG